MSKLHNANTNHRNQGRLALALMAGGLVAGCSGSGNDPWTVDPEGYDGLGQETFALLANNCVITPGVGVGVGTMALSVRGAETLYISLRAADNTVIADGVTGGGAECAVPSTYKIAVTEDALNPGIEKVFLDYINGPFALGSTTAGVVTPGITLALGATSSLIVRGSSGIDKISLGSTYVATVLQHSWINVNGDTSPDVRMDGITNVKVSTGVGADIITADGGTPTGVGVLPLDVGITFAAFGGPDSDTLTGGSGPSTLDGGDGDDKFIQTLTIGADNIVGGKGVDTVDYSLRLTSVNVTVCTLCSPDPSGCVAADLACRLLTDPTQVACTGAAALALASCLTTVTPALTTCEAPAVVVQTACVAPFAATQTACKTDVVTGCQAVDDACDAACTVGDTACVAACDLTLTGCPAACDAAYALAIVTPCTTPFNTAVAPCLTARDGVCTLADTAAVGVCTAARNGRCDAIETTCQAGATLPFCSVCVADDGAVGEGDTVNDDVEIVLGGKGNDTISAVWAVCSDAATIPTVKCTLKGNDGDDTLIGSPHADLIDGGAGNDLLQGGLGDDTLIGGAGFDTVSYAERTNPVKVSLDSTKLWVVGQNGEVGENDSIAADIENLTGGAGNDFLRGNALPNIIHGGAGNDTIEGGAGNDSLYGDAGNDFLYGGAGNDMLVGGLGVDTLVGGDGDDFLDSGETPAAADLLLDCDGVNDSAGTVGTAAGTADALVKDSSDTGVGITIRNCEL